jgi:hypothetical protein
MNQGLMRSPHRLAIVLLAMSTGVAGAAPTPKKPPPPKAKTAGVCGAKIIPLVVGNEWTYTPITLSGVVVDETIKKFVPNEAKKVVVKVTAIDAPAKAGGDTTVHLDETTTWDTSKDAKAPKLVDRKISTTIVCNPKKFEIDPSSFFFAGEPGGAWDLTFDKVEHPKGTSFALVNGGIGEAPWGEDIVAHFARTAHTNTKAKLLGGKLELERRFTPGTPENMNVKLAGEVAGPYKAEKIQLTGRVTLEGGAEALPPDWTSNDKTCSVTPAGFKCELPANWVTIIWLSNDVGILRMQNTYAHVFELSDLKLQ